MIDSNDVSSGFYFELLFKQEKIAFQEISGIQKELPVEEISAGGENRFKYKLPNTPINPNLILKRAIVPLNSTFLAWCSSNINGNLSNPIITNDISISLLGSDHLVYMKWTFHKAYPVKYSIEDLKSQVDELGIEAVELAYTHFDLSVVNAS